LEERASQNRANYLERIKQEYPGVNAGDATAFLNGQDVLVAVSVRFEDLAPQCDVLRKVPGIASSGAPLYEPTIVVGTLHITKEQKLGLSFVGYVIGQLRNEPPGAGTIVGADLRAHTVSLETADKTIIPTINKLRKWTGALPSDPPPVLLNKHCPLCQFREQCTEQAKSADDLSLLDRITQKNIRQY